ncbi:MAG TPA: PmoA family protein [Acidobacteriaceae bacterium]|nr:PmoA family protein [Acidobacteriaceae bacterium]
MRLYRAFALALAAGGTMVSAQGKAGVKIDVKDAEHRVDITVDGQPFTSYLWKTNQRKPILYPLIAPDGTTLTRGNPPLPGQRTDHPHHAGLWFDYSNVNNIDYWNNSDAIKPEARAKYGSIDLDRIVSSKSGRRSGELVTESTWYPSSDVPSVGSNKTPPVMHQKTRYVFRKIMIGDKPARAIDLTVTLTAISPVVFHDDKDGLLALRVAPFLESATAKPQTLRDSNGIATTVGGAASAGASGVYRTSEGKVGEAAWSTRGRWCELTGTTTDGKTETIAILDHPANPNYPTYWHARDYGLFAANPLGAHMFDEKTAPLNFSLGTGKSATFRFRVLFLSNTATPEQINMQADQWSKVH